MIIFLNPLLTSPVAATGLCKDAADRASKQRVNSLTCPCGPVVKSLGHNVQRA